MTKATTRKDRLYRPRGLCLALVIGLLSAAPLSSYAQDLEESVCGLMEPVMFWIWSRAAGAPRERRALRFPNVEAISFTTQDKRVLRGYRINNVRLNGFPLTPKGYLLVVQGNAMLADQLVHAFIDYAHEGYDVYIYDYRGYGSSEGRARLKAIVADYQEITQTLNNLDYPERLLYGISFGGIIVLNVIGADYGYDAAVIDSTPSRLSPYGCPVEYDPVHNLPEDSSRIMVIAGERDRVVSIEDMAELLEAAEPRSAAVIRDGEFAHPFMDEEMAIHRRRMETVRDFLLQAP